MVTEPGEVPGFSAAAFVTGPVIVPLPLRMPPLILIAEPARLPGPSVVVPPVWVKPLVKFVVPLPSRTLPALVKAGAKLLEAVLLRFTTPPAALVNVPPLEARSKLLAMENVPLLVNDPGAAMVRMFVAFGAL